MQNILNQRMYELREAKRLTQTRLAVELGIDQTSVSSYETGKYLPLMDVVIKYANYFDVSTDYLLGLTDVKTPLRNPVDDQTLYAASVFASLPPYERSRVLGYMERVKEETEK